MLIQDARARVATTRGVHRRRFYIGASVLMGIIAVAGFWPTYFGPLVSGTIAQPPLIHLHATVFTGWLVLFLTQAVLAATGRLSWHLRLGQIGIGYAGLLVIVGLYTGISRSADRLAAGGDARGLLFAAVSDMVVFSAFFAAAVAYRRRPQIHKRLMMVAATMLLVAATARMQFLPVPPLGLPVRLTVWFSPIALAMAHDFKTRRLVHPVYLIGLGIFLVRIFSRGFIVETGAWAAFTRWATKLVA
jgi:hypothetical protein